MLHLCAMSNTKQHTMTSFQIHREFRKALDEGADTGVAAKECADKLCEYGILLPKSHQGPTKRY